MHLDLNDALSSTCLASTTFHVEGEAPGLVAPNLRLWNRREELANRSEGAGIGGRVRSGRAADGRLVDIDDLVEMVEPFHPGVSSRALPLPMQPLRDALVQDFIHQCALTRPRYACDAHELAERESHVDRLEVVLPRSSDPDILTRTLTTPSRNAYLASPTQEL